MNSYLDWFDKFLTQIREELKKIREIDSQMTPDNYEKTIKKYIKQLCLIVTIIEEFALFARESFHPVDGPGTHELCKQSKVTAKGIPHRIGFTANNWFFLEIPAIPSLKSPVKDKYYYQDTLFSLMREYVDTHDYEFLLKSRNNIVVIRHLYDRADKRMKPYNYSLDHGQIFRNIDPFINFNLSPDRTGYMVIGDYQDRCCCQVFIVPKAEFSKFIEIMDEHGLDYLANNISPVNV